MAEVPFAEDQLEGGYKACEIVVAVQDRSLEDRWWLQWLVRYLGRLISRHKDHQLPIQFNRQLCPRFSLTNVPGFRTLERILPHSSPSDTVRAT